MFHSKEELFFFLDIKMIKFVKVKLFLVSVLIDRSVLPKNQTKKTNFGKSFQ